MSACACCDRRDGVGTYGHSFPVCFSCYASGRLSARMEKQPNGPRFVTHEGWFLPFAPVLVADPTGEAVTFPRWGILGRVLLAVSVFLQDAWCAVSSEYGDGHQGGYVMKLRECAPRWKW